MKKLTVTLVSTLLLLNILNGCKKENLKESSSVALSQQEKDDLIVLREDEKLARDVYLFSFDKYGTRILTI
jgi:hypothetical protein